MSLRLMAFDNESDEHFFFSLNDKILKNILLFIKRFKNRIISLIAARFFLIIHRANTVPEPFLRTVKGKKKKEKRGNVFNIFVNLTILFFTVQLKTKCKATFN